MKSLSFKAASNRLSQHRIEPHSFRRLRLDEAHELLPVVRSISDAAAKQLKPLAARMHQMVPADPRNPAARQAYQQVVLQWAGKIERLGLKVHGLWQVGFDCGEGWYCWQRPERRIRYFLEYAQTFESRSLLESHLYEQKRQAKPL